MNTFNWRFFFNSEDTWHAMQDAFRGAKRSIRLKDYIFRDMKKGEIGREFTEILKEKAREGISVEIAIDAFGSWPTLIKGIKRELEDADVKVFIHTATFRQRFLFYFFVRDHRKMAFIDEETAFLGGTIIQETARAWRDTHVQFTGPLVKDLVKIFDETWKGLYEGKGPVTPLCPRHLDGFELIQNGPGEAHLEILNVLLKMIPAAKERIRITTPFFSPPKKLLSELYKARERGVEIEILLARENPEFLIRTATESFYSELLSAGIKLFRYHTYMHAKTFIIDDDWATVGSANMDALSLEYNYEVNIASKNKNFIGELSDRFSEDLKKSEKMSLKKWKERPAGKKIMNNFGLLFRKII